MNFDLIKLLENAKISGENDWLSFEIQIGVFIISIACAQDELKYNFKEKHIVFCYLDEQDICEITQITECLNLNSYNYNTNMSSDNILNLMHELFKLNKLFLFM